MVAVAGLDERDLLIPNRAMVEAADVCAPARNVFTTIPGDRHNFLTGTSMSSAVVSGILVAAFEKFERVESDRLPAGKNSICEWMERLLEVSTCRE